MRQKHFLSLFLLALTASCAHVTVPNISICSVAGVVEDGGVCAHTEDSTTWYLTLDQLVQMLEAQPASGTTPAHGAALIESSEDFNALYTSLKEACRILGDRCTEEMSAQIEKMDVVKRLLRAKGAQL